MGSDTQPPSRSDSRSTANNGPTQVTVEAQSVLTTDNIHRIPKYKDLQTVIYVWGENPAFSRAGNAPARVDWTPSIYRQLSDVRIASVACAQSYMMLLSSSHQLYALGRGDYGQLGLGSGVTHVVEPTLLEDLPATTEVVCGAFHCLAVAAGGRLYSWGRSDLAGHSEGLGTYTPREVLISQGESRCRTVCASDTLTVCVCDSGQSLYHWGFSFTGEKIYKPQLLYSFDRERIRQVALGKCFGLALSETGAVFGWGDRTYGETLSCGSPLDPSYTLLPRRLRHRKLRGIVRVAAGERHALLMDRSGRVWSMGENMYGQCGVPPSHHCGPSPVDFPESSFVADKVACGPRHSACINSGRQLFTWGHSAGHKLIFTTAVEMLVQQQRQPGVSVSSGLQNCCSQPQLIYALLHEKVTCVGLASDYTVVVSGEGVLYGQSSFSSKSSNGQL